MTKPDMEPPEGYEFIEVKDKQQGTRKVSVQEILDITDVIQRIRKATGWGAREYLALILAFIAGGGSITAYFMWLQTMILITQLGGIP